MQVGSKALFFHVYEIQLKCLAGRGTGREEAKEDRRDRKGEARAKPAPTGNPLAGGGGGEWLWGGGEGRGANA